MVGRLRNGYVPGYLVFDCAWQIPSPSLPHPLVLSDQPKSKFPVWSICSH